MEKELVLQTTTPKLNRKRKLSFPMQSENISHIQANIFHYSGNSILISYETTSNGVDASPSHVIVFKGENGENLGTYGY